MKLFKWMKKLFKKKKELSSRLVNNLQETAELVDQGNVLIVHNISESLGGEILVDIEVNDKIQEMIKEHYRAEEFSDKLLEKFLVEALSNYEN